MPHLARVLAAGAAILSCTATHAVDGCTVLLCLAAPKWQDIPQCVPPIHQLMHDLALGKPFPVCQMSGAGNNGNHQWASAPDFCPPQYTHAVFGENAMLYSCDFSGAITVQIDGQLWSRTWWSMDGGPTSTEYSAAAKAQLGTWDPRFDDDYAAWLAAQPPVVEPSP